ncbi:hypothetical protein PAFU01_14410 [Pantoea ananatis]|nr:hypothetical protein PAFU01_14410 [Pantoea ananatis]
MTLNGAGAINDGAGKWLACCDYGVAAMFYSFLIRTGPAQRQGLHKSSVTPYSDALRSERNVAV